MAKKTTSDSKKGKSGGSTGETEDKGKVSSSIMNCLLGGIMKLYPFRAKGAWKQQPLWTYDIFYARNIRRQQKPCKNFRSAHPLLWIQSTLTGLKEGQSFNKVAQDYSEDKAKGELEHNFLDFYLFFAQLEEV
jgi:hypothetical protein